MGQGAAAGDAFYDAQRRLTELSDWLDGRDRLEGRFTVADWLMTTVLRIARHMDLIARMPILEAYRLRLRRATSVRESAGRPVG